NTGDLLELDREGFEVVRLLGTARTASDVYALLRARGFEASRALCMSLLRQLEARAILDRVAPDSPPLPTDPLADGPVLDIDTGMRAPIVAHGAVSYRCTLTCAFCSSESGPGREPGPNPQTRSRIVEHLAAWGVLEVALGGGEPTLLPDFPELLAAIRACGLVPNVTTNGTVHRPEAIAALAQHAGVVHLSADQPDPLPPPPPPAPSLRLRPPPPH